MPEKCAALIDKMIEYRKSRGLTQQELAEATNLSQSVIARMERKKVTPQIDTLLKVLSALDCDLQIVPAVESTPIK